MVSPSLISLDRARKRSRAAANSSDCLSALAMCWLAGNPAVTTVIAGATTPEQIASNVAATGWVLSDDERSEVDRICGR